MGKIAEKTQLEDYSFYLHYHWTSIKNRDSYIGTVNLLQETKNDILNRQLSLAKNSLKAQYASSGLFTNEELAYLDAKFGGMEIYDVADASQEQKNNFIATQKDLFQSTSVTQNNLLGAFMQIRHMVQEADEYQKGLEKLGSVLRRDFPDLVKEIEEYIILNWGTAQNSIMNSQVLSEMANALFAGKAIKPRVIEGKFSQLNNFKSDVQKFLIALTAATSEAVDASTKEQLEAHIKKTSNSSFNNIQGAFGEIDPKEFADDAAAKLMSPLLQKVLSTGAKITQAGTNRVGFTVKMDNAGWQQFQLAANNASNSSSLNKASYNGEYLTFDVKEQKADREITVNGTISIGGIQSKTYNNRKKVKITDEVKFDEMKIEDGGTAYTLLLKYFNMSNRDIDRILQVGVAHTTSDDASFLDEAWEGLKKQLQYGALVQSLIGYGNQTKNVIMQINRNFIPMEDFILYIINQIKADNLSVRLKGASNFPSRAAMVALNSWRGDKSNKQEAIARSKEVYPKALAKLQETKLTILLNSYTISDLAGVMF